MLQSFFVWKGKPQSLRSKNTSCCSLNNCTNAYRNSSWLSISWHLCDPLSAMQWANSLLQAVTVCVWQGSASACRMNHKHSSTYELKQPSSLGGVKDELRCPRPGQRPTPMCTAAAPLSSLHNIKDHPFPDSRVFFTGETIPGAVNFCLRTWLACSCIRSLCCCSLHKTSSVLLSSS